MPTKTSHGTAGLIHASDVADAINSLPDRAARETMIAALRETAATRHDSRYRMPYFYTTHDGYISIDAI